MSSSVGAVSDDSHLQSRLFVMDKSTGMNFLIDTGAGVSVIPSRITRHRTHCTEFKLYAANGTVINTFGKQLMCLNLGLRRPYKWHSHFLRDHGLLVDLNNPQLIDNCTKLFTIAQLSVEPILTLSTIAKTNSDNCSPNTQTYVEHHRHLQRRYTTSNTKLQ